MSNATLFNHTTLLGHGFTWVYTIESETPLSKEEILQQNPNNEIVKEVIRLDAEQA